jgi:glycosyltransferase involved in cell wall biosynthesis
MSVIKKLSIIIPVYNEVANILNAIKSVKDVKLPHDIEKEILIVDDASTDGTQSVLEKYSRAHPEIITLFHEKNRGK